MKEQIQMITQMYILLDVKNISAEIKQWNRMWFMIYDKYFADLLSRQLAIDIPQELSSFLIYFRRKTMRRILKQDFLSVRITEWYNIFQLHEISY